MPRYLLDARVTNGTTAGALDQRQPEVTVEQQWVDHADGCRVLVVCRAPSAEHVRLWAALTDAEVIDLRMIARSTTKETTP